MEKMTILPKWVKMRKIDGENDNLDERLRLQTSLPQLLPKLSTYSNDDNDKNDNDKNYQHNLMIIMTMMLMRLVMKKMAISMSV